MVASDHGCRVVPRLADIVDEFDVVGVDMPIGLPASGTRRCDREARAFLRPRGSTVFPAPVRAVVHQLDYATANVAARAVDGRGLPRQTFALLPKIREVDALVAAARAELVEIHPECAFARMAGRVLAPKRSALGRAERRELVRRHLGVEPEPLAGAAADDVLDAFAVLWSVRRYANGTHVEFGGGEVDAVGRPMRIVS